MVRCQHYPGQRRTSPAACPVHRHAPALAGL